MSSEVTTTTIAGSGIPTGPIADLTYRNYDGPLRVHAFRWWIIARTLLRSVVRRWWFWVFAVLSVFPYLLGGFGLFLRGQMNSQGNGGLLTLPTWGTYFYNGFTGSLFWLFIIAVSFGASSIAGDNRTNALQIYLSKPVTKSDYLLGKWAGLFILLATVSLTPMLLLYLFALAMFNADGFLKDDPGLIARLLMITLLPALLHTSLITGLSAWSRRPMLTGGIYMGLYIGLGIVTWIIHVILLISGRPHIAKTVSHLSIPGLLDGIAMHALNPAPTILGMFAINGPGAAPILKPELLPLVLIGVGLCIVGLALARLRIRAVEVIRG